MSVLKAYFIPPLTHREKINYDVLNQKTIASALAKEKGRLKKDHLYDAYESIWEKIFYAHQF